MDKDAKDFASQYPEFLKTPIQEIINAMTVAKTDSTYRNMYLDFIKVMVYGTNVPTFYQAIMHFEDLLIGNHSPYKN
jgi:hypothetical protein